MNRQARYHDAERWYDFGPVTHADAAKKLASRWSVDGDFETRDEGSDVVFRHRVTRQVVYDVVCLRNDEAEVGDE